MVHQPLGAAWPQESPRLVPWVPYVSCVQSLCGCFGVSTLYTHPWCHLLFPSVYDKGSLQASMVLHLHAYDRMSLCFVMQKHVFLIPYIKKHKKKLNNSKILKKRVGIHYQCHHMPILEVVACRGLPENLSPHRGNHRLQLSFITTMELNQLDRGWTPYLHQVCASHLPNVIGLDLEPHEEERQL